MSFFSHGGSPCQDFSFLGSQRGLLGDKSSIFFYFLQLWNAVKFLFADFVVLRLIFENVQMASESVHLLSSALGCIPILVNAADVGWHICRRLVWLNFPLPPPFNTFLSQVNGLHTLSIPGLQRILPSLSSIFRSFHFPHFLSNVGTQEFLEGRFPYSITDPPTWNGSQGHGHCLHRGHPPPKTVR